MKPNLAALAQKTLFLAAASGLVVVACAPPDVEPFHGPLAAPIADETTPAGVGAPHGATDCASVVKGQDPNQFPTCTGTQGAPGRCVPFEKMGSFADKFEAASCAPGTACVPDNLVAQGTNVVLKKCKPVLGKSEDEGRCFSSLAKDVIANYKLLQGATGDQCGANEVCTPCLNVLKGNEPTGVCIEPTKEGDCPGGNGAKGSSSSSGGSSGSNPTAPACPYMGPALVDVTTFAVEDCGTGMRCVPSDLLPSPDVQKTLKACSKGACAPEKSIAALGNYVPKTCASIAGAEGRCTNENVPAVASQKAQLPKDICDAGELCAPCFNPLDGQDSGACHTAKCDAPAKPATLFKACCERGNVSKGKCVPTQLVPANLQKNLGDDKGTCAKGKEFCVANEAITQGAAYKGAACQAKSVIGSIFGKNYDGVCLSDCLDFTLMESLGVAKGNCKTDELCVPCKNPLTQQATGAPGCAP